MCLRRVDLSLIIVDPILVTDRLYAAIPNKDGYIGGLHTLLNRGMSAVRSKISLITQ